jgi:SseB protein C-terminal domain
MGSGAPARLEVAEDQSCLICMPKQMPRQELFDALASAAKTQPNVRALYFCQIAIGQGAPHGAILIDLLPGTSQMFVDKIIDLLGSAINPLLSQHDFFDFFPSTVTGLADAIKKQGARIYTASPH